MTAPSFNDPVVDSSPAVFLMTNSFETGGSERQFVALVQSLEESSLRPLIGCIAKRGPFLAGFPNAIEFPLGGNLYGWRSWRARMRLARYLRRSRVGVAHAFDFYTNLVLIPAAKLAGVPVIIGSQRQLGDLLSPAKSRAQLAVLCRCDSVVCNSRAAADGLIGQGLPENKVVIIGNGLEPAAFVPANPALDRSSFVLRVGMIARMNSASKNHREFMIAAAMLAHKFPALQFVLAGDGPLRLELENLARCLGIGDRVVFLGDRRDVPAVLASLDISVVPSASESLSNAILESMAAGLPVVAAHVGGNAELMAEGRGTLVPVGDPDALAHAIETLLANPALRAEFGENGKKFVASNFTIATMRKRHEELYAELLERKTRPKHRGRSVASAGPLRVAIVAASSRYVGGHSVQADLMLKYWRADDEVESFLIPIDPLFPRGLRWAEAIPLLRTIVRQPLYLANLWRALRAADIAHIFSASYWSFLIAPAPAWMLARAMGKKTLIHYHSGEARDHFRRFRTALPVLARADGLVVPSRYLVDVFREFGLEAQAIPNVVDISQFTFRERNPLRPHLVCTRGFHPYYRVDLVVKAFAEVRRAFPNARLDLLGRGPQEQQIRKVVSDLRVEGVNFVGVVSRQEIAGYYDAADIFINASELDNMPVSVLEAFASGTLVVSTAPEGMKYLVEHERIGLLSEPGDSHALAQNVIRLLQEPALALRIACNAHEQAKRYGWSAVRPQWLNVYRSLAGGTCQVTEEAVGAA